MSQPGAPLRVAVVGLTHGHVEWLLDAAREREDLTIVGVWEPDRALFDRLAGKHSLNANLWWDTLDAMLEATEPEAVSVMTSTAGHLGAARVCLSRGVPCMFEKPLGVTHEAASAIASLARSHNTLALTNFETSWYASLRRAKALLDAGAFGPVRRVVFEHGHEGVREVGCYPEFLAWLTDPAQNGGELGGGAIMDFGCYGVCLMTWLMDGRRPASVSATTACSRPEAYPGLDTDSTIVLGYEGGPTAVVQGSWDWPDHRKTARIVCERGELDVGMGGELRTRTPGSAWVEDTEADDALPAHMRDPWTYLRCVLRGQCRIDPMSDAELNLTVCAVLDEARRSARGG